MYSPVWVHINMWARHRPEVDIQRLPLSSFFFFSLLRQSQVGSTDCWLARQASQWALWNPPASIYPIWGLQVHVACVWLLHGIWTWGFLLAEQAPPQSLVWVLSNKSGAGLLHSKLDSWNKIGKKKKKDWHRTISNVNFYTIPSVRCHWKQVFRGLIFKANRWVVMRSTHALTGWAEKGHWNAMWVRIYGCGENSAIHSTSEALCYY